MLLRDILSFLPDARLTQGDPGCRVTGVCHDSRRVRPGDLFVAITGARHDARRFLGEALARGAAGVVTEAAPAVPAEAALDVPAEADLCVPAEAHLGVPAEAALDVPAGVPVVTVPSARAALADVAAAVHGQPSGRLRMVGVTGTDGKTTTTHLLHAALEAGGDRVGRLSTLGATTGGGTPVAGHGFTTPEAGDLQRMLAEMVGAGCTAAVTEVSSHALALDRVRGCSFDAAVFTNLSPEHLDFHESMADYLAAKARLFAMVAAGGAGVVNADDPASAVIRRSGPATILTYGLRAPADVTARDLRRMPGGSRFTLVTPWGDAEMTTAMPGLVNVSNWLAAATTALHLGTSLEAVRAAAASTTVEGRMQRIDCGQPFTVLVDFAHTPQAMRTVLREARRDTGGRLLVLFGHAGGRDAANRRPLGSVAAALADVTMVTTDNPLHEDPAAIAEEIAAGARAAGARPGVDLLTRLDRRTALRELLAMAAPGDTVVLAGKGHERYQSLSTGRVPWSDAIEAARALAALDRATALAA